MMIDYKCPYCGHAERQYAETSEPRCTSLIECETCGGFYKVVAEIKVTVSVTPLNQNQGTTP
jgi:uncharacterized Zn finger protein